MLTGEFCGKFFYIYFQNISQYLMNGIFHFSLLELHETLRVVGSLIVKSGRIVKCRIVKIK